MSAVVLAVFVVLSAKTESALSIVAPQSPPSSTIDLETFVPSMYRLPLVPIPVCDIVVLSQQPTQWTSSLRPVKLASNFSDADLVSKCTFLYVFCNDQDPHDVVQRAHNFMLLQRKQMRYIWVVVLFLEEENRRLNLEILAQVIKKRVVFVINGRRIKYTTNHRSCAFHDIKCDLEGREFSVAYSHNKPLIYFTDWMGVDDPRNQLELSQANLRTVRSKFVGAEANLLKLLCEQYNITLKLRIYKYGTEFPNGTWVGKLGVVKAGRADIVAGTLPGNYRKNQIAHYSTHIFYYGFTIISVKPGLLPSLFAPMRPFAGAVWCSIAISVVLVGVSIWLLVRFNSWLMNLHCEFTVLTTILSVVRTLVLEPSSRAPIGAAKVLFGIWLLVTAILQASYSSRLMLSYSTAEYQESPETVNDLMSMRRTVLILDGGTPSTILRKYKDKLRIEKFPHEVTPEQLTDPSKVTMYDPKFYMLKLMEAGIRPLSEYHFAKKPVLEVFSGWLYSFQFDLTHKIDVAILRAGQFGMISKWAMEQKIHMRQLEEQETRGDRTEFKNKPLSLDNLQAVFLVFIIGNVVASATFIVELIISRLQRTRMPNIELFVP